MKGLIYLYNIRYLVRIAFYILAITIILSSSPLYAETIKKDLIQKQVIIGNEEIEVSYSSDFSEVVNKNFSAYLMLKHTNGYPTLNIISVPERPSRTAKEQAQRDQASYKSVGLTDAIVTSLKDINLKGGAKGFITTLSYTLQQQKMFSKVLTIPYEENSITLTFLYRNTASTDLFWTEIRDSVKASPQKVDGEESPLSSKKWLFLFSFFVLFGIYTIRKHR